MARYGPRFPPFGRVLVEMRLRGKVPQQSIIVALDSWKIGRLYPRIVIPPDEPIEAFNLRCLMGLEVLLCYFEGISLSRVRQAVNAVLEVNPMLLILMQIGLEWEAPRVMWIKLRDGTIEWRP